MRSVDRVEARIRALQRRRAGVVVIAIDGPSAAGKTTLAAALAERLGAAVVHGDDFYGDHPERDRRALAPADGVERWFDWERMRDEAIVPLRRGQPATFRAFDWSTGRGRIGPVTLEPRAVVIVEGVYAARPALAPLLDLTVLVSAPTDERTRRRRARHAPDPDEPGWDAAERMYFEVIRPARAFDVVVAGDAE